MITNIDKDDVYWVLEWGKEIYPDKPETEIVFEPEKALAVLLINEIVFLNNFWWEKDWPKQAQNQTSININCNDIFVWGSSDAEGLDYVEIQDLYDHYIKDPVWGSSVWCIKKRGILPQKPVYDDIQKCGIWNLEELNLVKK